MTEESSGQDIDTNSTGEQSIEATESSGDTLLTSSETTEDQSTETVEGGEQAETESEENTVEVPETYAFNMPEGLEIDQATADDAIPLFKELGLSQDQADKLTGLMVKKAERDAESAANAFTKQLEDWATELKTDKEVGGEAFAKNAGIAREAIEKFGPEGLKELLDTSGMGNNPLLFKFALAVGKHLIEDQPGSGDPAGVESSIEQRLYGTN